MPLYLYNKNPLDDVKYLFNKHVLFEDIPYMIANSFIGDYDEGDSFNWAKYKDFKTLHYTLAFLVRKVYNKVKNKKRVRKRAYDRRKAQSNSGGNNH